MKWQILEQVTEERIRFFCDRHGIPVKDNKNRLQVLDLSLLPGALRERFDKNGFFIGQTKKAV